MVGHLAVTHPLLTPERRAAVEAAVSADLGSAWRVASATDLASRASHPAALLHGDGLHGDGLHSDGLHSDGLHSDGLHSDGLHSDGPSVFAKLAEGRDAVAQAEAEVAGLALVATAGVLVPALVGGGLVRVREDEVVIVQHALAERVPAERTPADWRAIGTTLATLHATTGASFGADIPGYFGPLRQDNRPVPGNAWAEFYAERRVLPWLRTARDAGSVDARDTARVERLVARLPQLVGPDVTPALLHGDAQHHNYVSTDEGAVVIDASPYFGHPEVDLALVDYFTPVSDALWQGYQDVRPIDASFADRRELWRIHAYLAVLTVDATSEFGRPFRARLDAALNQYG